jgi:hypothetical protein
MKRCPQCEFIYEDEQSTCDMDGAILALEKSGAIVDGPRSMAKSFAVPAIVGTVLSVVLFLAFYTSPLLMAKPDTHKLSPAQTPPPNLVPAPTLKQSVTPTPSPLPSPEVPSEHSRADRVTNRERTADSNHADAKPADRRLTIRSGLPPLPRVPSLRRLPPARVRNNSSTSQVTNSEPKKQSKVGSFLKKTGRVIRKPFKF